MRFLTKFMLATAFVGSMALTSCKDYEEDDTNAIVVGVKMELAELQLKIDQIANQMACSCQMVQIVQNADGTYTIQDKDGKKVTVAPSGSDANGSYIINDQGQKVYIPVIVNEDGVVKQIIVGGQVYQVPAGGTGGTGGAGSVYTLETTVVGNKMTTTFKKDGEVVSEKTVTINSTDVKSEKRAGKDVVVVTRYDLDGRSLGEVVIPVLNPSDYVTTTTFDDKMKELDALNKDVNGYDKEDGTHVPGLKERVDNLEKNYKELQKEIYGEGGTKQNPKEGSILYRLNQLEKDVKQLMEDMKDVQDALKKLVTGIIVQQVWNPAIGTYNSIVTNGQTNFLFAYYGEASESREFPTFDPKETIFAGEKLVSETAGKVYVTINPVERDFEGIKLQLVNSLGKETAVKLGAAVPATEALALGWSLDPTRAAGNGTYILPATIDANNVSDYNLLVDKSQIKETIKSFVRIRAAEGKKIAAKEAAEDLAKLIVDQANNLRPEALGVQCAWSDSLGEHKVVSNFNIGAMAFKPLGFNALDKLKEVENVPGYYKMLSIIEKIKEKIDKKVIARINNRLNSYKDQLSQRGIIKVEAIEGEDAFAVTISYEGNADVEPTFTEINQKFIDKGLKPIIISHDPAKKEMVVRLMVTPIYIKDKPNAPVIDMGNVGYDDVNDEITFETGYPKIDLEINYGGSANDIISGIAMNDLATLTKMLNNLIKEMDGKIDKIENKAYDLILNFLDKANTYGTKAIHKLAIITKPTLLVNSDNGFGLATTKGVVPREVSGNVVIYPTTFSGETISPVYMRYIKVNDNAGEIVSEKEIDITSKLVKGENTIIYSALDYTGCEITTKYVLYKK